MFDLNIVRIFAPATMFNETLLNAIRALSSVGLEHLPYKQGVAGSNPAGPTIFKASQKCEAFFVL